MRLGANIGPTKTNKHAHAAPSTATVSVPSKAKAPVADRTDVIPRLVGAHVAAAQKTLGAASHVDPNRVDLYNRVVRAIDTGRVSPHVGLGLMHVVSQTMHKQPAGGSAMQDMDAIQQILAEHEAATGTKLPMSMHQQAARVGLDVHANELAHLNGVLQADNASLPVHIRAAINEFDQTELGKSLAPKKAKRPHKVGASASQSATKPAKPPGTKKSHSRIGASTKQAYTEEEVKQIIATFQASKTDATVQPSVQPSHVTAGVGAQVAQPEPQLAPVPVTSAFAAGEYHSDE